MPGCIATTLPGAGRPGRPGPVSPSRVGVAPPKWYQDGCAWTRGVPQVVRLFP